ncbi:replication-associated recombination protein A [Paenibacillus soyae]|uniref:Replication-associated recombination protein A n=1 Tax=Paenibacillus soyae TaxID=2969249 RepID=A0A9X2S8U8_9BACL|nr:replication-associated recombination protein A [Paenibacillus soyae]MCR2804799.1 replication-associated recombination protein A [Paenibacillus soyae]
MDLFDLNLQDSNFSYKPLSEKFRPQHLDDLIGQRHLIAKGKLLRSLIEQDKVTSMILQGPPSSGKTSLAIVINNHTASEFIKLNAVSLSVSELRDVFTIALDNLKLYNKKTIVFIDEIHSMRTNVQEALLPVVENGTITLIGATTESIQHDLIPPLVSRCRVYKLEALDNQDIKELILRALKDEIRGLGNMKLSIATDAIEYLSDVSNGDIRNALNALENAAYLASIGNEITLTMVQQAFQERINSINKTDMYNLTSAFCKSIRGGQTDAALYWMARLLDSGVDPIYIARRIVVHSSEDIGMANPHALQIALSAKDAVHFLGMPEGRIPLAQAVIYLCESPKSNSAYKAIARAFETVKNHKSYPVPESIRDGSRIYENPIDLQRDNNTYLPEQLTGLSLYKPQDSGVESKIYLKHSRLN